MTWIAVGLGAVAGIGALLIFWGAVILVEDGVNRLAVIRYNRSLVARVTGYRDPTTSRLRSILPQMPPTLLYMLRSLRHPPPHALVPMIAGVIIGGMLRDVYLTPYFILISTIVALYMVYCRYLDERRQVADDVKDMVDNFISFYRLNNSTFDALERTVQHVQPGVLKDAMEKAIRTFHTTRDPRRALDVLLQVDDPVLNSLVMLLSAAEGKGSDEMTRLLEDLAERSRKRWRVRLKAQGVFASLRVTLLVLVIALSVGMAAPAVISLWRTAFVNGTGGRFLYIILGLIGLGGGIYFDWRMRRDEEALL